VGCSAAVQQAAVQQRSPGHSVPPVARPITHDDVVLIGALVGVALGAENVLLIQLPVRVKLVGGDGAVTLVVGRWMGVGWIGWGELDGLSRDSSR